MLELSEFNQKMKPSEISIIIILIALLGFAASWMNVKRQFSQDPNYEGTSFSFSKELGFHWKSETLLSIPMHLLYKNFNQKPFLDVRLDQNHDLLGRRIIRPSKPATRQGPIVIPINRIRKSGEDYND